MISERFAYRLHEPRCEGLEQAQNIVHDEQLPIAGTAGPDGEDGDAHPFLDQLGYLCRDRFDQDGEGSSPLDGFCVSDQLKGRLDILPLRAHGPCWV